MGLLDSIFGGGNSGFNSATDALNKNRGILDAIKTPTYDQFNPNLYQNTAANYQQISDDPVVRSAQMQALSKMAGLADTGLSDADQAGFMKAADEGRQVAQGADQAAMQNAAARGVGGSGLEFAMREAGSQGGAQRAQSAAMDTAANAARQRALYQQAYGDQLAGVRGQDYQQNAANTGIINQFNMANTQSKNATQNANADLQNNAFQYNQGLKDKDFGNQMTKATGQMGINQQQADIGMAQADANKRNGQAVGGLLGTGLGYAAGGVGGAMIGRGVGSALF